jgi:GxxExxY protein
MDLGPGLLESVYEGMLAYELRRRGYHVLRQAPIIIRYDGQEFDEGFKADLLVNGLVIVELKSAEAIHPTFFKQVLTYLRLSGLRLGILVNFGDHLLKGNIHRVANGLPEPPKPPPSLS